MNNIDLKNDFDSWGVSWFDRTYEGTTTDRICINCGEKAIKFKDKASWREYYMSGLCQKCQDMVFED